MMPGMFVMLTCWAIFVNNFVLWITGNRLALQESQFSVNLISMN